MRTRIVRIGNSQGVRIPKTLLEEAGLEEDVEIVVRRSGLLIRAARRPRDGWDDSLAAMAAREDDRLLDAELIADGTAGPGAFDAEEWEWK